MRKTFVLCVSWKGPIPQTAAVIQALKDRGASTMEFVGITDVSLARCMGLAAALKYCDENPGFDVMLLLDDDVEPTADDAQALVDVCRKRGAPVSGIYGSKMGVVAAMGPRLNMPADRRWLTGLGFFALPVARLRELAERAPKLRHMGQTFPALCRTGLHPDEAVEWTSEDFWLCRDLGGVRLEPLPANHWKIEKHGGEWFQKVITVPQSTLAKIRASNGEP